MKKTYITATDVYMFQDEARMTEFVGTWRELLLHLCGCTDETEVADEETGDTWASFSDEYLLKMFNDANGDGQPFVQVWCVEDHKQVLGGKE